MFQLWKARFFIGTVLVTISTTLSYEVKQLTALFPEWLLILFGFLLSTFLAQSIVTLILQTEFGRKKLFGQAWLEGYWYLKTHCANGHLIESHALTHFYIQGDDYHYCTNTYRYRLGDGTEIVAISDMIDLRTFDLSYNNIFTFPAGDREERGISRGKFYLKGKSYCEAFEGYNVIFSEGVYRRQTAYKLPRKMIKHLKKEFGHTWKSNLLSLDVASIEKQINNYIKNEQ